MSYLLKYQEWQRVFEQATQLVPYKETAIPLGPNVSDGIVVLRLSSKVEVKRLTVNGVELREEIDPKLAKSITQVSYSPEFRSWYIYVAQGSKFNLSIETNSGVLQLPVEMHASKEVKSYYLKPEGSARSFTKKLLPVPEGIQYPAQHATLLDGDPENLRFVLIVKSTPPFVTVDCSIEALTKGEFSLDQLTKGENWFSQGGLDFFYLTGENSGFHAASMTFGFDPELVVIGFGQLFDPATYPSVPHGEARYVEITGTA
jgi:hypothetical protein